MAIALSNYAHTEKSIRFETDTTRHEMSSRSVHAYKTIHYTPRALAIKYDIWAPLTTDAPRLEFVQRTRDIR